MTSGPARVERLPVGRGDDPASTAAASPAVMAAQARLGELRRAMGYAAQPSAAELERAAKDAAWQRWAADLAARKKAKEAEAAADQAAARQRWLTTNSFVLTTPSTNNCSANGCTSSASE